MHHRPFVPALALASALVAVSRLATATTLPDLIEEVPFITTPDNVTLEMLRIADVRAGDHVIDLGSGDGRIVVTAAARFGATGLGVELVPDLVRQSVDSAQRAGVADRVAFRVQDIFETDLSAATVVTLYLLPEVNLRLRPALLALRPGTRIVSHDWDMGDWPADETRTLDVPDKRIGREKRSRVQLWRVPAPVHGTWCAGVRRLDLTQRYQSYRAVLDADGTRQTWDGRIDGAELPAPADAPLPDASIRPALRWTGPGALTVRTAGSGLPVATRFERSADGRCAG